MYKCDRYVGKHFQLGLDLCGINDFIGYFSPGDEDVQLQSSEGGGVLKLAEVKRVRSLFPETWIWLEYDARQVCQES